MTEPCAHVDLRSLDASVRLLNRGTVVTSGFDATAGMVRGHTASCCRFGECLLRIAQAAQLVLRAGLRCRLQRAQGARCSAARWGSCLRGLLPGSAGSGGHAQEVHHAAQCRLHGPVDSHERVGCTGLRGASLPGAPCGATSPWLTRCVPALLARLTLGPYRWGCRGEPKPAACTCMARGRAGGSSRGTSSSSCAASCCQLSWQTG